MDYIDLYLIHWPFGWKFYGYEFEDLKHTDENGHHEISDVSFIDTYRAMEELVRAGLVKSIGMCFMKYKSEKKERDG